MKVRAFTIGLGLLLVAAMTVQAQDPAKRAGKQNPAAVVERVTSLLPPAALAKLNLTEEQKKEYDKLQAEFREATKDVAAKAKDALQKARQDKDKEAMQQALKSLRQDVAKSRKEMAPKMMALLTAEQKDTLKEFRKSQAKKPAAKPAETKPEEKKPDEKKAIDK